MTQRTCNIIMCCKGHGEGESPREAIAKYMSRECDCPISVYNEATLLKIIKDAFFDYLDSCDKPSMLLRDFFEIYYQSDFDRIASVFYIERVTNVNGCINGFNEEMFEQSRIDLREDE